MSARFVVIAFVIFIAVCLCQSSSAQNNQYPNIPCPDVFQYSRSGNKIIGLITVNGVRNGETTVAIELSQPGMLQSNNYGSLSLNFNKEKVFDYISSGTPFIYRVDFPNDNIIPAVTSITVNDRPICSGTPYVPPSSNMKLSHTFKSYSSVSHSAPLQLPQYHQTNQPRPLNWPNFNQGSIPNFNTHMRPQENSQLNSPFNTQLNSPLNSPFNSQLPLGFPEFLKYSPTFMQNKNNGNSNNSNRPMQQTPMYHQMSPPTTNTPTLHYIPYPPLDQPFIPIPPSQQSYNTHSQLSQMPSYNSPPLNQNINGVNFDSFLRPPFKPQTYDPVATQPERVQKFNSSPDNPFLKKINDFRPPGSTGPRNPPPTPVTTTEQPTFTEPQSNPFDLDIRNAKPNQMPTPEPEPVTPSSKKLDPASFEYINSVCGRENQNSDMNKLNVKGQVISRSRFPWIVAIFTRNEDDRKFQCGGNLISTRTVVSAAHCFYLGLEIMRPEDIMISMGLHNLTNWLDAFNADAERIIQHPDYNPILTKFDADIAVVRLKDSVVFTGSIRPICIWQGAVDAREIEGVSGIIVGWGGDGRRNTTTVPTLVYATVVSELTCIRSNDQFISLTSNRTLCAGNLDGSGPCMGDSGNGLMIRNRNKWMLRGTVSGVLGSPTRPCLLDQYAVYSDIAMFIEWIRTNMLL